MLCSKQRLERGSEIRIVGTRCGILVPLLCFVSYAQTLACKVMEASLLIVKLKSEYVNKEI